MTSPIKGAGAARYLSRLARPAPHCLHACALWLWDRLCPLATGTVRTAARGMAVSSGRALERNGVVWGSGGRAPS
eukprot:7376671-Prymnesium_polylepis.2